MSAVYNSLPRLTSNPSTTVAIIADIAAGAVGGTTVIGIVPATGVTRTTTTHTMEAGTATGLWSHSPSVEVVTGAVDATGEDIAIGVAVTASTVVIASTVDAAFMADAVAGRGLMLRGKGGTTNWAQRHRC